MNHSAALNQLAHSKTSGAAQILDQHHILPRTELIETARKAKTGDPAALTAIINATSRLAYQEAAKQWRTWAQMLPDSAQFDDVYAASLEGVLRAIKKYDPDSGNSFTTYASFWIRTKTQRTIYNMLGHMQIPENAVRAGINPSSHILAKTNLSIERGLRTDGDNLIERIMQPSIDPDYDDSDTEIERCLTYINPRLWDIAQLAAEGYTDEEIGDHYGFTREWIRQLRNEARSVLIEAGIA